MERYEEYKDSGVEWIGEIPAGWEVVNLGSLAKPRKSINKDGMVENVLSLSYGKIKRRVLDDGGLLPESFNTYNIIEAGDTVLRLTDLQNDQRSLRVGLSCERGIITAAYESLAPQNVAPGYLYYCLAAFDYWKGFYGLAGGVRQGLNYASIRNLRFLLPPVQEQRAVSDYLDRKTAEIDSLVEDCEREIELLQEYRKAVISEAVTKGLDPNAPMKDSGIDWIGEIPEEWDVVRVRYISEGIQDGTHGSYLRKEEGIPLLSAKNVTDAGLNIDTEESYISCEDACEITKNGFPRKGDVLFACIGASIGKTCIYELDSALPFQRSVAMIRPLNNMVFSSYLSYALKSDFVQQEALAFQNRSTQGGLYLNLIGELHIACPPMLEQCNISTYLDKKTAEIDSLIADYQSMADKLREYRKSLISETVTGKFKVPGVA